MAYPENPNTIVIKNMFYPQGLTELDVWNYYQKNKTNILRQTMNRDITLFIMIDVNKPVIKRRGTSGSIRLTPDNYDSIITGRTVSIHSSMGQYEDFSILDIDIDPNDDFRWAKDATRRVYDFVMDKVPIITTASIIYTGKYSFHIKCEFGRKIRIETIKSLLEKFLRDSELSRIYSINKKRTPGIPNIDLNRTCFRCNYITLHSLSIWGLKSMEVDYAKLMRFDKRFSII